MCMNNINLNLKKTKNGFIGIGYKVMWPGDVKMGKWQKAKAWEGCDSKETANDGKVYYPGFHIWTKYADAVLFAKERSDRNIYQVSFKEVVCFGSNFCVDNAKPCVVTNWIKYNKKV